MKAKNLIKILQVVDPESEVYFDIAYGVEDIAKEVLCENRTVLSLIAVSAGIFEKDEDVNCAKVELHPEDYISMCIAAREYDEKHAKPATVFDPAKLDERLVDQEFTIRATNVLKANGLNTVRDLVRMKRADVLKWRNGGKKTLIELEQWLENNALSFGMDV